MVIHRWAMVLALLAAGRPAAADGWALMGEPSPSVRVLAVSPIDGETGVAVTRETVVHLSAPIAGEVVPAGAVTASFAGSPIPARVHLSPDRRTISLFYQRHLPAAARVRVIVDGARLMGADGLAADPDGDGRAGGTLAVDFDTVSLSPVAGTSVVGRVFASEWMAPAGTRKQAVNRPLAGVRLYVEGAEDTLNTTTDALGNFRLEPVPAGDFFVYIDGRTVATTPDGAPTRLPAGPYYPFVGKRWQGVAGRETSVGEVYLPLVAEGTLRVVSATEPTVVEMPAAVLAARPEMAGVRLVVPPNALFSDDGLRGGRVGLAPVEPDRIPSPLPAGLELPLVITVQTDGAANFDEPVPVCFPNVDNPATPQDERLAPGTRSALWSFDHDIGDWVIAGTMTVSADGLLVCSDPGVGIREPGWHGTSPAGQNTKRHPGNKRARDPLKPGPPPPPPLPPCPDPEATEPDELTKEIDDLMARTMRDCLGGMRSAEEGLACRTRVNRTLASIAANYQREAQQLIAKPTTTGDELRDLAGSLDSLLDSHFTAAINCGTPAEFAAQLERLRDASECLDSFAAVAEEPCTKVERQAAACATAPQVKDVCESLRTTAPERARTLRNRADAAESANSQAVQEREKLANLAQELNNLAGFSGKTAQAPISAATRAELTRLTNELVAQMDLLVALGDIAAAPWSDLAAVGEILARAQADLNRAFLLYFPAATPDRRFYRLDSGEEVRRYVYPGPEPALFLPPDQFYTLRWFEPESGLVGMSVGRTAAVGAETILVASPGEIDTAPDTDGDGLSDEAEAIIGTNPAAADSDGDGISDGAEIAQGSNPMDGLPVVTGIVGAVELPGPAVDVVALDNLAAVAHGNTGVTLFNVFNPFSPVRVGQIDTAGIASRVALNGVRLAVADGPGGVVLADVADAPNARIVRVYTTRELEGEPAAVLLAGDLLVIVSRQGVLTTALATDGRLLARRATGSVPLDLALTRDSLAVLDAGAPFVASARPPSVTLYPLAANLPAHLARVQVPVWYNSRLFGADTRLYATNAPGYEVIDVAEPTLPVIEVSLRLAQVGLRQLALTKPDEGVAAVAVATDAPGDVELFRTSAAPPLHTPVQILGTPGDATSVAVYGGIVYTADGTGGLQVINPRPYDAGGVAPPPFAVATSFPAEDPQAERGALVRLTALATDDVQLRSVEWYRDGRRELVDGSFPFEWRFRLPRDPAGTVVTLRARAYDTGGNARWSDPIALTLTEDTTPPDVAELLPPPLSVLRTVALRVFLTEAIDPASITGALRLQNAGPDRRFDSADDIHFDLSDTRLSADGTILLWDPPAPLPGGLYRAILVNDIRDLVGNYLPFSRQWDFVVYEAALDSDGDCLPDAIEELLFLNPNNPDSNGNGIPDGEEDFDFDGVPNCLELFLGFDPRLSDSDEDGVPDGQEDRDRDALPDVEEWRLGTDPDNPDTDGDGFLDGEEVLEGTSPLNAAERPSLGVTWRSGAVSPVLSIHNAAPRPAPIRQATSPMFSMENQP